MGGGDALGLGCVDGCQILVDGALELFDGDEVLLEVELVALRDVLLVPLEQLVLCAGGSD